MLSVRVTSLGLALLVVVCLLGWLALGRGDGIGTCYPVEGSVLVNGTPLQGMAGLVMFVPDQDKGNSTPVNATGEIDSAGRYKLSTKGRPGAPAGWYRVVVNPFPPGTGERDDVRKPAIHARFTVEKTTPLRTEVVAAPSSGTYDLPTTKN